MKSKSMQSEWMLTLRKASTTDLVRMLNENGEQMGALQNEREEIKAEMRKRIAELDAGLPDGLAPFLSASKDLSRIDARRPKVRRR